ncbi:hypothetical protein SDC9_06431 [bioreactor metagenome]|uniref:Uncharacterized protein n=1 Tax=bioreactor metagenome TaxID=1076179 RepID=A0A644T280_9ZZZZ
MPVGPAVARGRALEMGADLMDRALHVIADERAIGADLGLEAVADGIEFLARAQHAAFDQLAEGHARLGAFRGGGLERFLVELAHFLEPLQRHLAIGFLALDADVVAAEHLRHGAGGAGAKERVEHHVARIRRAEDDAVQKRLGLLRRMRLVAGIVLQPLVAGANRQHPVRAHLHAFIQRLQRLVVEGVFRAFALRGPDQRLMRVGEPLAAEVRHRVRLAPDHVVQDPVALILQLGAETEDVVIGADHPDRPVRLQDPARGGKPVMGEAIVMVERAELIPGVVDGVDLGIVGPVQLATQLQVIGRIGEDEVDACLGQAVHHLDAVACKNLVERQQRLLRPHGGFRHVCLILPFAGLPVWVSACADLVRSNMSQRRFPVKFFFESSTYRFRLAQDVVYRLERTPMNGGHAKI